MPQQPMTPPLRTSFETLFLWLSDILCNNIAVWWSNVGVVVLDGVCDFEPKFLVKIYSIFVVCLHMQVSLRNVFLGAELKNMVQQPRTCQIPRIKLLNQSVTELLEFQPNVCGSILISFLISPN